jgi:hypothetical protein
MKIFELGTMVKDTVSKTEGMITHAQVDMDGQVSYIYQPRGLNPKTKAPVDRILINGIRISGGVIIDLGIPLELLGTKGEDIATGFKGTIVGLVIHLNGCIHVNIKPEGTLESTGATIEPQEFDIRRVKGPKITKLSNKELKESIKKSPSPITLPKNLTA